MDRRRQLQGPYPARQFILALSIDDVRSAVRAWVTTDHRSNQLGFRVGRMLSTGVGAIAVAPGVR